MKDLSRFLNEKKEDKSKPRLAKKGEGTADAQYLELMSKYKVMRQSNSEEAAKLLDQAQKLVEGGEVSKKALLAAAYL